MDTEFRTTAVPKVLLGLWEPFKSLLGRNARDGGGNAIYMTALLQAWKGFFNLLGGHYGYLEGLGSSKAWKCGKKKGKGVGRLLQGHLVQPPLNSTAN